MCVSQAFPPFHGHSETQAETFHGERGVNADKNAREGAKTDVRKGARLDCTDARGK